MNAVCSMLCVKFGFIFTHVTLNKSGSNCCFRWVTYNKHYTPVLCITVVVHSVSGGQCTCRCLVHYPALKLLYYIVSHTHTHMHTCTHTHTQTCFIWVHSCDPWHCYNKLGFMESVYVWVWVSVWAWVGVGVGVWYKWVKWWINVYSNFATSTL